MCITIPLAFERCDARVDADLRVQNEARLQQGLITDAQLAAQGLSKKQLRARLNGGYLERIHPGVCGIRGVPDSWLRRVTAAYLWAQPRGGVVSHRTAAALHDLDGADRSVIELSLPSGSKRPGLVCHRLTPGDRPRIRRLGGVDVTWVERTILDLGAVCRPPKVGRSLDDALRTRKTTLQRLWSELETNGGQGRGGSSVLGELLSLRDDRDGLLESRLETATLRMLRDKRLPFTTPQHRIYEGGTYIARLDFAYPGYRLGVEAHSYRWHAGVEEWKKDQKRDNRLKLLGWTVLHYTWDDVHFERERVVSEIGRMLMRLGGSSPAALPF